MILSIAQETLAQGLSVVSKAVESRPTLPVLANILLEAEGSTLSLTATNLQMSISWKRSAKIDREGAITLPAKTFVDLINNLSSGSIVNMELDTSNNTMRISSGSTKANIKGIDADEYPPVTHGTQYDLEIDARLFQDMIVKTAFAVSKEESRPILTGVYTLIEGEKVTMAAADGFRLSVRTGRIEPGTSQKVELVIPARALNEVARVIDDKTKTIGITLPSKRDLVTFHLGDVQVSSQLLEGRFPDFAAIIPRSYTTSTLLDRAEFLKQCKRAEIFSRDNSNISRLYVMPPKAPGQGGTVIIAGKSAERGDTDGALDAHIEGQPLDVSFNIRYLIDVLNVIDKPNVVFESNGAEYPGVIRIQDDDTFVHVIMPMSR
ncbi:MAG: DNA polymerase III subunit beta [Anaerolineae bacterium]|nr:DNA polymerase III subunit beta [Anaerolineae bacterium]MDW8171699.1 DNA polymerase III subunit beta [Anaerolineae bacterium]